MGRELFGLKGAFHSKSAQQVWYVQGWPIKEYVLRPVFSKPARRLLRRFHIRYLCCVTMWPCCGFLVL